MNTILNESLERSMSYQDYRQLVNQLVKQRATTGNNKTELLVNYTKLNDLRMRHWDKSLIIPEDFQKKLKALTNMLHG